MNNSDFASAARQCRRVINSIAPLLDYDDLMVRRALQNVMLLVASRAFKSDLSHVRLHPDRQCDPDHWISAFGDILVNESDLASDMDRVMRIMAACDMSAQPEEVRIAQSQLSDWLNAQELPWFRLHYHCPDCNTEWEDEWSALVDSECPSCGVCYTVREHETM